MTNENNEVATFSVPETVKNVNISAVNSLDAIIKFVDENLLFRGLSFQQWANELAFPPISEILDKDEVIKLNAVTAKRSEVIYQNMAIAKATHISAKAKYTSNVTVFKSNLLDQIEKNNNTAGSVKIKNPSSEVLDIKASAHCINDSKTLTMAEIVLEFWKCQVDNLSIFNTRVTSLSISKHNDEKYSNY